MIDFTISGFGDEIADDPAEQLDVLASLGITHLDLRAAWGRNVLDLTGDDVRRLRLLLRERGAHVAMIASPVGKRQISEPAAGEAARIEIALRMAEAFETPLIRLFSFYHEGIAADACRAAIVDRLGAYAVRAEAAGVMLLLENEGDLWGDRPARCLDLLASIASPRLRLTLDAGNFASLGVKPASEAYPLLRPWIAHVQIKDVRTSPHAVVPAGMGDGQIPELLALLNRDGYRGYLSLEPHLAVAGKAGGFSGPDLFGQAARALDAILAKLGR